MRRIEQRRTSAPKGSYTARLFDDPSLLRAKLQEEALELAEATNRAETIWESADLLYFTLVAAASKGASLNEIVTELDRRSKTITRRGGDAKEGRA